MSIKNHLTIKPKQIVMLFLAWRAVLLLFAFLGVIFLPLRSSSFLGGGVENYLKNPLFWGWANFDGEHYLSIAQNGYQSLKQAFFPLYPMVVGYISDSSKNPTFLAASGLLVSNISFLASLFLFWKLVLLDYSRKIALLAVVSILIFPTSFYFGSLYSESLFILLTLGSFYAARKGNWLLSGILGALASATRVVGTLLLPALFLEWRQSENKEMRNLLYVFLVPTGLLFYMLFLKETLGDPLAFYNLQVLSGEQRATTVILLYQVFWRYIKMLATMTMSDPIYLTIFIEAVVGFFVPVLLLWGYIKKIRFSYLLFGALAYILPTLTGSFSSMPRYVLVIFPVFILLGIFFSERKRLVLFLTIISVVLLAIETMLFIRGYWVA